MKPISVLVPVLVPVLFLLAAPMGCASVAPAQVTAQSVSAEEATFTNNGVTLAATFLIPAQVNGAGAVFISGSGPATREDIRAAAEKLAAAGVTVLIYDKRGSGASTGDWTTSSLDDLAADATAGLEMMRNRHGVTRAGFWVHSQGNWVATRAAELGAAPDFLVAVSGGGVSPRIVERRSYAYSVSSLPAPEQAAAMVFVDRYFDYLAGKISREDLDADIATAKPTEWYARLGIQRVLVSQKHQPKWQWVAAYDPATFAAGRDFPVLVLLGAADHTIPIDDTAAAWKRQLGENDGAGSRIDIFIGRDHHLRLAGGGHGLGLSTDDEVMSVISAWLNP